MTTPDPKTVREIARTFLTDPDADELDYVVRSYIGYASGAEHQAWRDAVRADADDAEVVTIASWPDEHTTRPAADLAHAAEDVREHLALRDRAVNDEVLDNPDVLAVARADGHGHALTVSVVRTLLAERDALATYVDGRLAAGQDGDLGAWLTARQADVEHDHDRPGMTPASCYCGLPQPCEQRADDMAAIEQLRAILARRAELVAENARLWEELEAKQPQDDGDVRAVAALAAADNDEQLDRAVSELIARFADRIAALEARDTKAPVHATGPTVPAGLPDNRRCWNQHADERWHDCRLERDHAGDHSDGMCTWPQSAECAPQQPERFADECDCECQPGQPCLCPERDCYCGPCRVCGENPQQPERDAADGGAE